MILKLLLTYWGRRVCILKVTMYLKTKLTEQDIKNFTITNRLGRVFFLIIQKILEHPSQVYRISHLLPSTRRSSDLGVSPNGTLEAGPKEKKNTLTSLFVILKFLVSCCVSFVFSNISTFNTNTLLPQYVSKSLSSINSLKSLITT